MSGLRLGYGLIATAGLAGLLTLAVILPAIVPESPTTLRAALGLDVLEPADLARRQAEAIAVRTSDCLRTAGIDANPVVEAAPEPPDADLAPIAWAERWGFGVSTAVDQPAVSPIPDPNLAAAIDRGADARTAYLAAFLGDGARPGCHDEASRSVLGLQARVLAPLSTDLAALDAAIDADPTVGAARERHRACIRPVADRLADGPQEAVVPALLDGFAARVAEVPPSRNGLAVIQADERRVAVAFARCDVAFAAARAAVAAPAEAAFVAAHREILRAMRATLRREMAAWPTLPP